MKEYTTLEMIEAAITGSQKDIFQCNTVGKDKVSWKNERGQFRLVWLTMDYPNFQITEDTLKLKWTKVQQPVSFIEAAKAFHKGKIIKVDYQNGKATNTYDPHKNGTLTDNHGGGITTDEILEGTWYIEE